MRFFIDIFFYINSTSSDDSDVEVISIQNEIITLDDDDGEDLDSKSRGPIRVDGEFTIDSLPPIEDLKISVPEDECVVLGKVMSIVDQLGKQKKNSIISFEPSTFQTLSTFSCCRFIAWLTTHRHRFGFVFGKRHQTIGTRF